MTKKRLSKSSLLWLVRSRSYISVSDVRRRFNVELSDDATAMLGPGGRVFVGLPSHQASLLEELWRDGKVGLELAPDVRAPIVTGVYGVFRRGEHLPPIEVGDRPHCEEREESEEKREAAPRPG